MKKRQRSKAELLHNMKTYAAMKKDAEQGTSIQNNIAYWGMGVIWCATLWKEENFSTNELVKFLQYIKDNDVTELTEERREEIREAIGSKGVEWILKNTVTLQKKKNAVDQAINELTYHNTKVSVDYSLLACEYLIKHKGYAKKRLNRVIGDVYYLDGMPSEMIGQLRQELFDNKGIWIELGKDDIPDGAEVI